MNPNAPSWGSDQQQNLNSYPRQQPQQGYNPYAQQQQQYNPYAQQQYAQQPQYNPYAQQAQYQQQYYSQQAQQPQQPQQPQYNAPPAAPQQAAPPQAQYQQPVYPQTTTYQQPQAYNQAPQQPQSQQQGQYNQYNQGYQGNQPQQQQQQQQQQQPQEPAVVSFNRDVNQNANQQDVESVTVEIVMIRSSIGAQECEIVIRKDQTFEELKQLVSTCLTDFDATDDCYAFFHEHTGFVFDDWDMMIFQALQLMDVDVEAKNLHVTLKIARSVAKYIKK
mmetsp:Transcript_52449/g.83487  ORF Transcript_52449/g.83487 Transcript_52449/m.83487 type:complete len:276 (-) Transcript_52449:137-964(-)